MSEEIQLDQFSKVEHPGEFRVEFEVRGRLTVYVRAADEAEAKQKAYAKTEDWDDLLELDEVTDVDFHHVYPEPTMYRVLRNGSAMQVSVIKPGDIPREPDKYDF